MSRYAAVNLCLAEGETTRMQVATGTVINGKIIVEGVPLVEGTFVTVVCRGVDETFGLTPEQEAALASCLKEVDQGQFVSLDEVLGSLPKPN